MLARPIFYTCDAPGCEATSPVSDTVPRARALAEHHGWHLQVRYHVEHSLCPDHRPQVAPDPEWGRLLQVVRRAG